MDLDESGKYESYSLQLYNISTAVSCARPARDVQHCGLALSTSALSLCVCPVSGRVMVLLSNGILIIVQAVDGMFELVLELVCQWFLLHFVCLVCLPVLIRLLAVAAPAGVPWCIPDHCKAVRFFPVYRQH